MIQCHSRIYHGGRCFKKGPPNARLGRPYSGALICISVLTQSSNQLGRLTMCLPHGVALDLFTIHHPLTLPHHWLKSHDCELTKPNGDLSDNSPSRRKGLCLDDNIIVSIICRMSGIIELSRMDLECVARNKASLRVQQPRDPCNFLIGLYDLPYTYRSSSSSDSKPSLATSFPLPLSVPPHFPPFAVRYR